MPAIDRREFLAAASGAATISVGCETAIDATNLLFILADQWRSSALGCGSDAVVRTPHIDSLASQGANWRRAYAANPVCTPNRACILTGRHSHQTGMIRNDIQLPPQEVCWPEALQNAGYATHYVGKWHLDGPPKPGYVPPGWRRRGFATFEGFNRGHIYHRHWGFDDSGEPLAEIVAGLDPYYEPTLQTDLAIDFMRRNLDRPFACYLSWGPPHTPFRPPDSHDLYEPGEIVLRENVPAEHHAQARKDLAGYYGLCESLDHEMGRLMAFLDESGLRDNTLLIFTADHGELAGSHGKYRKGEPESESLQVPLMMRLPGRIGAGSEPETLISSVDLMPTLLSLCDVSAPETWVGSDLAGVVTSDGADPSVESIYCQGKVSNASDAPPGRNSPDSRPWRSLVTQRYKLNVRADHSIVDGLFDLQEDPLELHNLANTPESRSLQSDLLAELRAQGQRVGDPFPAPTTPAKERYESDQA